MENLWGFIQIKVAKDEDPRVVMSEFGEEAQEEVFLHMFEDMDFLDQQNPSTNTLFRCGPNLRFYILLGQTQ